jgi:hypothetical protein
MESFTSCCGLHFDRGCWQNEMRKLWIISQ